MPVQPYIAALRAEIGRRLRKVTEERLRELSLVLPSESKARDYDFRSYFLAAAARYWSRLQNPKPKEREEITTQAYKIKSQLKKLRSLIETLSIATNSYTPVTADEILKEITSMKRIEEALEHELDICQRTYGNQATNRRLFVFDALEFWERCGGTITYSRLKGKRLSGALIRYLVLACDIVMDEHTLGPEALVVLIRKYRGGSERHTRGA